MYYVHVCYGTLIHFLSSMGYLRMLESSCSLWKKKSADGKLVLVCVCAGMQSQHEFVKNKWVKGIKGINWCAMDSVALTFHLNVTRVKDAAGISGNLNRAMRLRKFASWCWVASSGVHIPCPATSSHWNIRFTCAQDWRKNEKFRDIGIGRPHLCSTRVLDSIASGWAFHKNFSLYINATTFYSVTTSFLNNFSFARMLTTQNSIKLAVFGSKSVGKTGKINTKNGSIVLSFAMPAWTWKKLISR